MGQVATYAILWAALQRRRRVLPQGDGARAVEWLRERFDQTLTRALATATSPAARFRAEEAIDLISSYGEAIGDLDQALPGEEQELDGLLRRQPM